MRKFRICVLLLFICCTIALGGCSIAKKYSVYSNGFVSDDMDDIYNKDDIPYGHCIFIAPKKQAQAYLVCREENYESFFSDATHFARLPYYVYEDGTKRIYPLQQYHDMDFYTIPEQSKIDQIFLDAGIHIITTVPQEYFYDEEKQLIDGTKAFGNPYQGLVSCLLYAGNPDHLYVIEEPTYIHNDNNSISRAPGIAYKLLNNPETGYHSYYDSYYDTIHYLTVIRDNEPYVFILTAHKSSYAYTSLTLNCISFSYIEPNGILDDDLKFYLRGGFIPDDEPEIDKKVYHFSAQVNDEAFRNLIYKYGAIEEGRTNIYLNPYMDGIAEHYIETFETFFYGDKGHNIYRGDN